MNDNFYPSVTWAVPISNSNTPMLTHITRDQSFITWLVAMNAVTKVDRCKQKSENLEKSEIWTNLEKFENLEKSII